MDNPILNQALKPVPYIGKLLDHPHTKALEKYLESIDIPPEESRAVTDEYVNYQFFLDTNLSVAFALYRTSDSEVFLHFSCAMGCIDPFSQDELLLELLKSHQNLIYPIRYAIDSDNFVVVEFRCATSLITESCTILRAASIIHTAVETRKELVVVKKIMVPLPSSWFKECAAN